MTSFLEKKVGPFSVFQMFGILGAILVIASFFLAWGTLDVKLFIGNEIKNYSGMDFFNKNVIPEGAEGYDAVQNMFPLICLILAVVSLILAIIPDSFFKEPSDRLWHRPDSHLHPPDSVLRSLHLVVRRPGRNVLVYIRNRHSQNGSRSIPLSGRKHSDCDRGHPAAPEQIHKVIFPIGKTDKPFPNF